ncbi:MAG: hypothetical protein LBB67_05600 [Oscillospiraceae bacterium]|jgi:SulP family sulfate permease|nr:hypothetical protein [Oscillospiraceae bacterium]
MRKSQQIALDWFRAVLAAFPMLLALRVVVPFDRDSLQYLPVILCFVLLLGLTAWKKIDASAMYLVVTQFVALNQSPFIANWIAIILFLIIVLSVFWYPKMWTSKAIFAFAVVCAVVMTLYQTAGYFAVGAQGTNVWRLLQSYGQLGFHANWRTVLFSTIMLVVLITFPRKFKRLHKIFPASLFGILLVTGLNMLLNPIPARSTVLELGHNWLFFERTPISALSMLLIYAAWNNLLFYRSIGCVF